MALLCQCAANGVVVAAAVGAAVFDHVAASKRCSACTRILFRGGDELVGVVPAFAAVVAAVVAAAATSNCYRPRTCSKTPPSGSSTSLIQWRIRLTCSRCKRRVLFGYNL